MRQQSQIEENLHALARALVQETDHHLLHVTALVPDLETDVILDVIDHVQDQEIEGNFFNNNCFKMFGKASAKSFLIALIIRL